MSNSEVDVEVEIEMMRNRSTFVVARSPIVTLYQLSGTNGSKPLVVANCLKKDSRLPFMENLTEYRK